MSKIKIKTRMPWIAYSGSFIQQNYAEDLTHGYLLWDIAGKTNHKVKFCELPNPKPFVSIEWLGSVDATFALASEYPNESRFRICCKTHIGQGDAASLTSMLKNFKNATEVTFKHEQLSLNIAGEHKRLDLVTEDLHNPETLFRFLRNFHHNVNLTDEMWDRVREKVTSYAAQVSANEDSLRNAKWSIKKLEFDNTFTYGESNVINFENLSGIVGVFGANRIGKSSLVGTLMYSLFNTTDRGPMKNIYVCNVRKQQCLTNVMVNVAGADYLIRRETTKLENKKGIMLAPTKLSLLKIDHDGNQIELDGEQRSDTEKTLKSLIGTSDDFLMTSAAVQGEMNTFISNGSTSRLQTLSRFLDLNVFEKLYEISKKEVNTYKSQLKLLPDRDWDALSAETTTTLQKIQNDIILKDDEITHLQDTINAIRTRLVSHSDYTPVSFSQLEIQKNIVDKTTRRVNDLENRISDMQNKLSETETKIATIETLLSQHDLGSLKKRQKTHNQLKNEIVSLRHIHENESTLLKHHKHSLKLLDEVPCGDSYPTCKFIKDAHLSKESVPSQEEKVKNALEKLSNVIKTLDELKEDDLDSKIEKLEKLFEHKTRLISGVSHEKVELTKLQHDYDDSNTALNVAKIRFSELEEALKNHENDEVLSLKTKIDLLTKQIKGLHDDKIQLATQNGRLTLELERLGEEKKKRELLFNDMKISELITSAFSKKGIPNVITSMQLPLINAEIAKILSGIVDFTIELEITDDDGMEVYINYGDSKRVIELSSGMEKMIASIAIRVALINVSTLPKTDMFIIDEGFGTLDDASVEACNKLLTSLKRYFKSIIVITHVDSVKDIADVILEITKSEKDAHVNFE